MIWGKLLDLFDIVFLYVGWDSGTTSQVGPGITRNGYSIYKGLRIQEVLIVVFTTKIWIVERAHDVKVDDTG